MWKLNEISKTLLIQRGSRDQPCLTYEIDLFKYCHTYYEGWTHLRPKLSGVSEEEGNGVVIEKRESKCGEDQGFVRVKSISYF